MHDLKDRLKEPTSYLGLASVFQGIGECLQGNYESGIPLVFWAWSVFLRQSAAMQNNITDHSQHLESGLSMAVAKTSPPVLVSGLTLAGVQLQDWLIMATILYTVIQIVILLPKLKQSFSEWRKK